jgi:DNA polymerase-3 subunit gamma/tau
VVDFAARLTPEDCQLFYQIGIIGRRDLSLAPDPQSGFEMVLLRMLAFRPVATESTASPSRRTKPRSQPERKPTPVAPAPEVKPPGGVAAPAVAGAAPARASGAATPTPADAALRPPVSASGELDWNEMVTRLELHGLVRELARNTALKAHDGKFVDLLLAPQHENLHADRLIQGLETALNEQLKMDVKIRLSVDRQRDLDTPSKRMTEAEAARQREAERAIEEDPTIKSLQDKFGATIESVEPR